MAARILVCDGLAVWRAGLRAILESEPDMDVVGEASDGHGAVAAARELIPDVALIDGDLMGPGRVGVTRHLAGPGTVAEDRVPVLVLTSDESDDAVVGAVRDGARGILRKDVPGHELVDAVRVVAAGHAVLAPSAARTLLDNVAHRLPSDGPHPGGLPAAALPMLTQRERQVLALLGRGLTNAEMAQALTLSRTTVKSHVSHVLGKLELSDRAQAVVLAYEAGLVRPAWLTSSPLPGTASSLLLPADERAATGVLRAQDAAWHRSSRRSGPQTALPADDRRGPRSLPSRSCPS